VPFVQLVDVAPSVLSLAQLPAPASMEGRPMSVADGPNAAARRAYLVEVNRAAQFRDGLIRGATLTLAVAQVVLCGLAVAAFRWRRFAGFRRFLAPAALGLLAVPLGFWLAGGLPFYRWGGVAYAVFVLAIAIGVAGVAIGTLRRNPIDPVVGVLAAVVGLVVLDVITGARLQLNTVLGYSPTVAGRFIGLGNLAYAVLGASAVFLAGLLAHRIPGRRGRVLAGALLVVVCLVDGLPFFGADVGGMLSLVPASAAMMWLLSGRQIRVRAVLLGAAGTVAVVFMAGFIDLARPATSRTHLGRLFERVRVQGWDGLWTVVERKAAANLGTLGLSVWTLLVPVLFLLLAVLLYKAPGRLREVKAAIPEMHAVLVAFGILALLGFALNDSGIAIPGVMLGIANAVLVFLTVRIPEPEVMITPEPARTP
jgi:hypothetical protein